MLYAFSWIIPRRLNFICRQCQVEVQEDSQIHNKLFTGLDTTVFSLSLPSFLPQVSNLEPLPTLTPRRNPPPGYYPYVVISQRSCFEGLTYSTLKTLQDSTVLDPFSMRWPHHGCTAHTTSRWKFQFLVLAISY